MALGGLTHWTVGLLATFMSVACVVAADTGAYAFGKTLGRTQLTAISPKKTVEGAFGGLLCSTALALGFWRVLAWPAHPALAVRLRSPQNSPFRFKLRRILFWHGPRTQCSRCTFGHRSFTLLHWQRMWLGWSHCMWYLWSQCVLQSCGPAAR